MPDFSQFFSAQPWGSWGSGSGQAPQPPMPQGPQVPPEVIAALRAKLGLDEPAEAQAAAEAAAARVRAPYAKANERQSGLPDIFNYYSNKIASAVTAPRDALTGAMQVTDPETGMPTREAMERGQGVANLAMTGGVPFAKQGAAGMAGGKLAQRGGAAVESEMLPKLKALRGPETSHPDFVYHATNLERAQDIADGGSLKLHKPSDFTDQSIWPDGSREKRNYFTPTAQNTWQFAPEEGQGVLLRIPKDSHPFKRENTGDLYSTKPVPAHKIEALGENGEWMPLKGAPAAAEGQGGKTGTLSDFITAYHSSPHDFDRFDISKVGTGQGAASYGHGIYAAENPAVSGGPGSEYWNEFARTHGFNTKNDPEGQAVRMLEGTRGDRAEAIRKGEEALATGKWNSKNAPHLPAAIDLLKSDKPVGPRTYQVAIKAPPEHFLDWDKPLSEQHPKVREILKGIPGRKVTGDPVYDAPYRDRSSVQDFYHTLARDSVPAEDLRPGFDARSPHAAMAKLREAGIPGIKYLDQGSRGAPAQVDHLQRQISGLEDILRQSPEREDVQKALAGRRSELEQAQKTTRNYVVFDDKLIDILKKYGIAGLAALPAMNAYHYQDKGN